MTSPAPDPLKALIHRVQTEPPSAELDCRIWQVTHPEQLVLAHPGSERRGLPPAYLRLRHVSLDGWDDYEALRATIEAPPLTSDLADAANFIMSRGVTGYDLHVSQHGAAATVRSEGTPREQGWSAHAYGRNGEMALLAAMLQVPAAILQRAMSRA